MGFVDNFLGAFSEWRERRKISSGVSVDNVTPTGYEVQSTGIFDNPVPKQREALQQMQSWVGAAVTAISDEVATIQLHLYKQDGDVTEEVVEHPILDLLYKVNAFTTKYDHFWLTQAYLELTGEAPWFLEREGNEVTSIYFLLPDKLRPIAGKNHLIVGYEYEVAPGQRVKLALDEVLFLKYPNPAKPFRGIGTLEMAARTVDVDNYSEEWNKKFYVNSARPDAILSVNTEYMDEAQKEMLKKSLRDSYEGIDKAHRTMVLFGNMQFEKSGFTMKDMDFLEQQKFGRDKILGIFRVPKAIVAQTEGVNYASSKSAEYIFARWTIKPKMERLIQQLNEFLLPMFEGTDNMFLDYESPVPEDDESELKVIESGLKYGWLTINEVREMRNMPPVDGGDEINPTQDEPTVVGQGMKVKKDAKTKSKFSADRINELKARGKRYFEVQKTKKKVKEEVKKALIKHYQKTGRVPYVQKTENSEHYRRVVTEEEQKDYWETKNAIFLKHEKKLRDAQQEQFKQQRKSTLIKLNKVGKAYISIKNKDADDIISKILLDKNKETKVTLGFAIPILEELMKEAGTETLELLGLDDEFDVNAEEVQKLLKANVRKFAKEVTDTTNEAIKTTVVDTLAKGGTIDDIRDGIKGLFTQAEEYRAQRIARTETLRHNTAASEQAFIDSEIVEGKKWITNPNPCAYCETLRNKTAPLGGLFLKKGDTIKPEGNDERVFDYEDLPAPPLHPNCQCDIIPIFKSAKSIEEAMNPKIYKKYVDKKSSKSVAK